MQLYTIHSNWYSKQQAIYYHKSIMYIHALSPPPPPPPPPPHRLSLTHTENYDILQLPNIHRWFFSQIQLFAAILLVNILVSITNKEANQTWLVLLDCLPLQVEGWFACNNSAKYQNQSSLATTKTPMLSTMGRDSSVGRKARRNTDTGSSLWCGKGRFSHS